MSRVAPSSKSCYFFSSKHPRREKRLGGGWKSRVPEMPFPAFWREILQNSEDNKTSCIKYTKGNIFQELPFSKRFCVLYYKMYTNNVDFNLVPRSFLGCAAAETGKLGLGRSCDQNFPTIWAYFVTWLELMLSNLCKSRARAGERTEFHC